MSDNFASLGAGLLARKGGAKPAMRPQVSFMPDMANAAHNLEDLGWNDMGDEPEDDGASKKRNSDIFRLTPEPANPEAEAQTQQFDEQAHAKLGELYGKKPVVLRQQEEIADRIDLESEGEEEGEEDGYDEGADVVDPLALAEVDDTPEPAEHVAPSDLPDTVSPLRTTKTPQAPAQRKSALDRGKRAAFTLRLDAQRHLKLRLACTLRNRSAQQLVTQALDNLLGDMADVDTLAAQVHGSE